MPIHMMVRYKCPTAKQKRHSLRCVRIIPLHQGLFLNCTICSLPSIRRVLIPLNQGLFLNDLRIWRGDGRGVLIPLNQGLFLNAGCWIFFSYHLCKAAFQFFSCRQSCLIFLLLPYFLSSADAPMLRLLSAASMRHVPPNGLFVVVAAGFTGW